MRFGAAWKLSGRRVRHREFCEVVPRFAGPLFIDTTASFLSDRATHPLPNLWSLSFGTSLPIFLSMNDDLLPDLLIAVEQQLTSPQTPYVAKTLARLLALGIEEGEAKNQIALCLGEEMDQILRTRKPFDENAYRASLQALPLEEEEEATENSGFL